MRSDHLNLCCLSPKYYFNFIQFMLTVVDIFLRNIMVLIGYRDYLRFSIAFNSGIANSAGQVNLQDKKNKNLKCEMVQQNMYTVVIQASCVQKLFIADNKSIIPNTHSFYMILYFLMSVFQAHFEFVTHILTFSLKYRGELSDQTVFMI